jgi:serine/threonine-protein kinase HipA
VENEWLCARIVAEYGLPIAPCDIGTFGEQKVLIVERFDRQLHSSGRYWLRLMQEDMAQATGTPWHRKYQADGGPGVIEIARILRGSQDSKTDLTTLFKAQVLFWMLAATDGHAKNFSLRILSGGHCRLTPLYDVLSAWPVIGKKANEIPPEKVKMAMSVPGERPHYLWKSIHRRHFEAMGRKLGLGAETTGILEELAASTDAVITRVQRGLAKGFPQMLIDRVLEGLRKSARALAQPES